MLKEAVVVKVMAKFKVMMMMMMVMVMMVMVMVMVMSRIRTSSTHRPILSRGSKGSTTQKLCRCPS